MDGGAVTGGTPLARGRGFVHHGGMEWVTALLVLAVVAAALVWWRDRHRADAPVTSGGGARTTRRPPAVEGPWLGPTATIRLDVVVNDPEAASAQRLVTAASNRVLRTSPDVDEVIVEDRDGTRVATVPRHVPDPGPPPTRPEGAAPPPRPHGSWREPEVRPSVDQDVSVGRRPLADRLELSPAVRSRVADPDDAVDVVRAILAAAEQPATVTGSMVRSGDDVVIVVESGGMSGNALSQAFLRFRDSGARRGVVVHLGYVDPSEVARRRALVPELGHAGPEVLQAMADAVELGGDPIQFALSEISA